MVTALLQTGGRKLLFANHGLNLPSIPTVRSRSQITHLLPSLHLPTSLELFHNITERVLIDEIALEERPTFVKWLNSIGGLCRGDTSQVDLSIMNGVRRAAFHVVFMMETLGPQEPFFEHLGSLAGFNS
jgi:hypothetical protein